MCACACTYMCIYMKSNGAKNQQQTAAPALGSCPKKHPLVAPQTDLNRRIMLPSAPSTLIGWKPLLSIIFLPGNNSGGICMRASNANLHL